MTIEGLVRPFQTVNVFNPPRAAGTPVAPSASVVQLKWGLGGTPKTFSSSYSSSTTGFMGKKTREFKRVIQPVKIKNPDEPAQHITANITYNINVTSGAGQNFERQKINYARRADLHELALTEIAVREIEIHEIAPR